MAGKYNLKDVGVIYLDALNSQQVPQAEPNTGILSWKGDTGELAVNYELNQQPTYTVIPTGATLALTPTGLLAQNFPLSGFADANTNNVLVGAVYLPAGNLDALSAAYMRSAGTATLSLTDTQQVSVATFTQNGSQSAAPVAIDTAPVLITEGWYEIYLGVAGLNDSADVYGLRIVIVS